jgi:hypothetical protein
MSTEPKRKSGGARPGAGRPRGKPNKATQARQKQAAEKGPLPFEIITYAMHHSLKRHQIAERQSECSYRRLLQTRLHMPPNGPLCLAIPSNHLRGLEQSDELSLLARSSFSKDFLHMRACGAEPDARVVGRFLQCHAGCKRRRKTRFLGCQIEEYTYLFGEAGGKGERYLANKDSSVPSNDRKLVTRVHQRAD